MPVAQRHDEIWKSEFHNRSAGQFLHVREEGGGVVENEVVREHAWFGRIQKWTDLLETFVGGNARGQ